jgi:hypothetical protein
MVRRVLGATAGLAAVLSAGWTGVALVTALVLVPVLAICWVVADPDRPRRLALLLTAWRRTDVAERHQLD